VGHHIRGMNILGLHREDDCTGSRRAMEEGGCETNRAGISIQSGARS